MMLQVLHSGPKSLTYSRGLRATALVPLLAKLLQNILFPGQQFQLFDRKLLSLDPVESQTPRDLKHVLGTIIEKGRCGVKNFFR